MHNNYLTLPVVFTMMSPHFAFTYAHAYNWLVLFVLFAAGMLVRHYFNLRNQGRNVVALPVAAFVIGIVLAWAIRRASQWPLQPRPLRHRSTTCTRSLRHAASPVTRPIPRIRPRPSPRLA